MILNYRKELNYNMINISLSKLLPLYTILAEIFKCEYCYCEIIALDGASCQVLPLSGDINSDLRVPL